MMKKAERKKTPLMANLGDLNRALRVRPVRYLGREWWAVDAEDTWPGMVMDLRRLGFEAVATGEEVLVREQASNYEAEFDGSQGAGGLRPFPTINPKIRVRKEAYTPSYDDIAYLDELDDLDMEEDSDEWDTKDLDEEEN